MSSRLFSPSPSLCLLCFTFLVLVNIQLSLSNPWLTYEACIRQFRCGDIRAGYPFWGGGPDGRPKICGHPHLELQCEGDMTTTMFIDSVKYRVLTIDEKEHVLTIARWDYLSGICSSNFSDLPNTTFDSELFEYSGSYKNFTILYVSGPGEKLICSTKETNDKDGFTLEVGLFGPMSVKHSVSVPVEASFSAAKGNLSAALEEALIKGFMLRWKVRGMELCEKCYQSYGICNYNNSFSETNCFCPDQPYHSPLEPCPPGRPDDAARSNSEKMNISIGIAASVVGIVTILCILLICRRRNFRLEKFLFFCKNRTENDQNIEAFVRNYGSLAPHRYNYSNVKRMTKSFSNKLGQGGYGNVYKGELPDGRLVAVKVLKESKGNGEEFINEVASISRTSHLNIVTFLGFCYERKKRALIYEFMPNGSLDKYIYDQEPSSTVNCQLEWKTMYQIAVGVARGLEYLHRGCNIKIVHFDIKPHNILLDEDFCPKISDFGLAKQSKKKESIISMLDARGTIGYIAPEVFCRNFGRVSHKSDVYSYGMMILEMVGGRRNIDVRVSHTSEIYFPTSIYKHVEPGKDFEFHGVVTEEEKEIAKKMLIVGLWCIQTVPSDRPSIIEVLDMLEDSTENLQIPPKPSLSSPARSIKHALLTSSSSTESKEACMLSM